MSAVQSRQLPPTAMKVGTCIIYALKVQGPKSKIYEASSNLCGQILPAKSINEHMISNVLRKTMDFLERWLSGRKRRSWKPLGVYAPPGFESLSLRHKFYCAITILGCSQDVRHRTLNPRYTGPIPATPANALLVKWHNRSLVMISS